MKNNRLILFLIITGLLIIPFCEPEKKMMVETGDVSNVSTTTANVSGTVIDVGEGATQHGHCYGTEAGPSITGTKTSLGTAVKGDFTSSLTGLTSSTKYYVRAYCSLGADAAYGSEITFTTASAAPPELTTTAITSITKTSAVTGGIITSEGGTPVTARGVCWNVAPNPTISNSKTSEGTGSGSFASSISGLTANTVYYMRAYATNSGGTAYGNELTFTTSPEVAVAPTVTTVEVTSVTANSAVSGGDVTSEGGAPVTAKGVCWHTSANPTITNSKTVSGSGSGSFVSNLTGLLPGTTYYVRAYATNSAGTSYGNESSFATSTVVPTLTTIAVTSVTSTSATSGGDITGSGGASVTVRGVCWSTSQNPTIDSDHTTDGTGTGTYSSSLTGLTGNTTYYIRAYATNNAGTGYGNELNFKTSAVVPALTTSSVTSITSTTATSGGDISSDGGSNVTARGVCWNTATLPTITNSKTTDGTGTGSFASSITGLAPGTAYHVRAYATNSVGTGYGNDVPFTTVVVVPTVTTTAISAITSTTATSGGNVTSDGGANVTDKGVCWSTSANPTTADSKTSDGMGTGSFVSSITGLTPETTYHVRAYATNNAGTGYGNELTFKTNDVDLTPPTAAAATATLVANTTATINGAVNANGSSTAVTFEYGTTFLYGSTADATPSPVTGVVPTNVSAALTGLIPGTTYHFRVKAVSAGGTVYSSDLTFTTLQLPSATTDAATAVTETTAILNGTVNANGSSTTVTFEYGTTTTYGNTVTASQSPVTGNTNTNVSAGISGLSEGVTYHFRIKAISIGGTSNGTDQTFSTSCTAPTATTNAASSIGSTTATLNGTVNANGFSTTVTFEWGLTTDYGSMATASQSPIAGSTNTAVSAGVTGLTSNTLYHYRVKAVNCEGTPVYGTDQTLTTLASLTTTAISNITSTTASGGGTIAVGGGANITTRGVCWSTSTNPTIANSKTTDDTGTGSFTSSLTGLTPNTPYYVRSYATNAGGTVYGTPEQPFTTKCVAPTATTNAASGIGSTTATLNGTVNASGFSTTVTFEWGLTTGYGSTATASQSPVTGSTNTAVSAGLTGLTPNTTYHYRVKAVNCEGTSIYGGDQQFITKCVAPTATTNAASGIGSTTATLNGTVNASGFSTTVTFEWDLTTGYGSTATTSQSPVTGSTNTAVSAELTGLTPNTTYHYRVKAVNCEGTPTYGIDQQFTTCQVPSATTNSSSSIGTTTATLNGTVNANGFSTTVIFEYGSTTSYGSTITATQSPVTGSSNTAVSADLTDLTPNNTYHYRVKAVNCEGTPIYGDDQQFTTLCTAPSATTNAATNLGMTTVTLNGTVNANNFSTTITFEYGTTTGYGSTIAAAPSPVGGSSNTAVSAGITGLSSNKLYHYRVKTINCGGTIYGSDQTFTTLCPASILMYHTEGTVSAVTKTVTYEIVQTNLTGDNKCWITQNLGADNQAGSATDATEAAAGWYWQFNRKQGYKHDGITRTPGTTWISSIDEASDWTAVNDPCTICFGTGWRIPTHLEWTYVDMNGGWGNYNDAYASVLKIHAAGYLLYSNGSLSYRGSIGYYWSRVQDDIQTGWLLYFDSSYSDMYIYNKAYGFSVRCLRD